MIIIGVFFFEEGLFLSKNFQNRLYISPVAAPLETANFGLLNVDLAGISEQETSDSIRGECLLRRFSDNIIPALAFPPR